ncbi:hypothetical protein GO988_16210 [Hymenobacter sp. HMF4947]|uniref:Uncharacterized protein n=1 Tax=Hymenobacter ginkgonis TaxID=2682976 RepID=A0A7K1THI7_9BACT|nr:hypothetical protein [Hymenobacter ginkgonis]MVN77875.1 hypothetical protein [Hymenobacter ginkgonis]
MLALKRVVTVAVMVYLLLALLFLLLPAVRTTVADLGSGTSPTENERNFFYVLAFIGVIVMALQLIVENIDSSVLRRTVSKQDGKINELKATLYDTHQRVAPTPLGTPTATPTGPAVAYPTAAEAAAREQRQPEGPPATPPSF